MKLKKHYRVKAHGWAHEMDTRNVKWATNQDSDVESSDSALID